MRRVVLAFTGMVVLAFGSCGKPAPKPNSSAATGAAPTTGSNAAPLYRAVWARMNQDLNSTASAVVFDARGAHMSPGAGPSTWDEAAATLRASQPVVEDLIKAAAMEHCDFALPKLSATSGDRDMDQVVAVTGSMRDTARLLRADAVRAWSEGDTDAAVDRITAIYGLCVQTADEPVVVVSLTNAAVVMLADEVVRTMASGSAGHSLSGPQRGRLRDALGRLDTSDPVGLTRARKAEGKSSSSRTEQSLDGAQSRLLNDLTRTRQALAD